MSIKLFKLKPSDKQLDKASDFFLDLAKLLIASTVIGFFFPESTGGNLDINTLFLGLFSAVLLFAYGLKIIPKPKSSYL